ncbi:amidohydrolase family protein [Nonlabens ulvanivorans]|uniref:Amidohydrolase n=1 Tax=Nonlabens ulvanivorans TaxID=906888 RepID=A0A084JWW5_NONUL|nr:amidohydrolase family protein [Nonlabens ulvanivorans]KEZ93449.1 amidohydrolase [Nonlabens ulvanivorans]PRX14036.1 imidazolonepropionase-like amidohydrolase [Nonlabens ulvanivorans]
MKRVLLLLFLVHGMASAQEYFPNNDDISARGEVVVAITNATIVTQPGTVINNGTIILKDGKISNIGSGITVPTGAVIQDANGSYIYPSFIEPYADFGMEKAKRASGSGQQYDESRQGYYWNDHIRAEQDALDFYKYDEKEAEKMIDAGYGAVQTHMNDGIARGSGMLVALNNNGDDGMRILKEESGSFFSLKRSVQTRQSYPTSLMGTLALLRQTHFDADWYSKGNSATRDLSLEALVANKNLVQIIEAGDKKNVLRVDKMGDRVGKQFVIVGGEDAYEMIDDIKATNASLILPINFPDAYDVTNPYQEWYVNLADMREWKQAPANPFLLSKAGINYAITSQGLKTPDKLMEKLKMAMEYGLTADQALAALTTKPAQILGVSDMVGTLQKGKVANFIMTSGPLFEKDTKIYENWVQGSKHVIKDRHLKDIDGSYTALIAGDTYKMDISGDAKKVSIKIDSTKLGGKIAYDGNWITITASQKNADDKTFTRMISKVSKEDRLTGTAYLANGNEVSFTATKDVEKEKDEKEKDEKKKETKTLGPLTFPNVSYGSATKPQEETILYRNATVWTNEKDGILENTDVLVKNGKISKIGKNLSASNARVIDATGKHLTSGIIDEHSHIAIDNGVNEAGHNSTAEVTIEDVVDHEDVNIYRDLAGGVTTSQLLHGSANPIGGRSAIIKLKWGYSPEEMIYSDSPKFIKFALGENVKQSRYQNGVRFPQTRMGVEQVFEDYFTRAREYADSKGKKNFRYDEEMEVILEILESERFVSCHSYVQTEINMLMKVAEKHGFRINTFTHILEGYKMADKMKEHGVGGSTFSDWWAYKYEVNDAIPYNAAIMHSQGVVTAINSDDAEMSRRLNQEAAKAVKYGNVSEEDAWKFVTLNPAKLLHIDDRTGSIKTGKDADLVLWSDNPLSVAATAEVTMIDGIVFFDKERDLRFRESIKEERQQLINEMIAAKNKGLKTQEPKQSTKTLYECNTLEW